MTDCTLHITHSCMLWGQGQGEQEQQLRSELSLEKAQLRRQHERELKALQDKMADEPSAHATHDLRVPDMSDGCNC